MFEQRMAELRRRLLVGRSTHDLAQARAARAAEVDYVAFGPLFGTHTKQTGYDARGLEGLRDLFGAGERRELSGGAIDALRELGYLGD